MSTVPPVGIERRRERRWPAAFAFWFQPDATDERTSAWMLNISSQGAAFLTAAAEAPVVGQRLRLLEMLAHDRVVRQAHGLLSRFARVLRIDDTEGVTRRVAVRFEADVSAALRHDEWRHCATSRSDHGRGAGAVPPPLPAPPGPRRARCVPGHIGRA